MLKECSEYRLYGIISWLLTNIIKMNSKKTGYMWFIIAVVFISAYESFNFISQNTSEISSGKNIILSIAGIISIVWLFVAVKYLIALFQCKKGIFLWTNIYFGLGLLEGILEATAMYFIIDEKLRVAVLIPLVLFFAIRIAIWVTFYKHLVKAQTSGVIVLN
jgi:hypothetical protein